ncbi:MAG: hypothetical protein A2161_16195 [Candidatus Schekmanbacteria bacterium RBG_13_48_7]|uniref:ATPase F1/V1/A1 complex alpha/beta subunit nucleotide-binding domain-containing protein n=1 Tax=Candidatus Schekmanbacteria bacterium RBG_13_48_7 TaxID=1817878 RepID=A0A1F7RSZ8_9BACT|nr:MAG: hypothetical protein A2161_16195 [Candidatus Schekmanbacteria bacterium RBG_13_48_7]
MNDLGEEGLQRSVLVVSTSDQPALLRIRATFVAMAIAEYFKDQGKDVMLMMDSITRFAMAQREVGLAVGEPTTSKGYTPSVFALLPRLLERAGNFKCGGSITGFFTVLVENDDMNDPIADAVRSILDGHLILSRQLAARNQFPAIDVLGSISRLMIDVASTDHFHAANRMRSILAVYKEFEDLIQIGAYKKGSQPEIDNAINMMKPIAQFLHQDMNEKIELQKIINLQKQIINTEKPDK